MPTWPRSNNNGSEKPAKEKKAKSSKPPKPPKPPAPEIVIIMPGRRKKEFGMGTFGTEPMDTIASPPPPIIEPESEQVQSTSAATAIAPISISDQLQQQQRQDDNRVQQEQQHAMLSGPCTQTNNDTTNAKSYTEQQQLQQQQDKNQQQQEQQPPGNLHLSSSQPFSGSNNSSNGDNNSKSGAHNSNNNNGQALLREQLSSSLKTPGALATPGPIGFMTPHSNRTSYFPATPASGNTFSTTTSTRSTSTAAFGNSQQQESTFKNNNSNSLPIDTSRASTPTAPAISTSTSTSTPGPVVPETAKRSRHLRSDIPPAIVTRAHIPPSSSPAHLYNNSNNSIYQTPSTPRMPSAFSNSTHDLSYSTSASACGFYPTPASSLATATTMATPKTPSTMSEWRMMQMQLQQQDDLNFSLTLPSVSALSLNTPNNSNNNRMMMMNVTASASLSSPFGLTPAFGSGTESVLASVSGASSACSCCCYGNPPPPPSTSVADADSIPTGAALQSPSSSLPCVAPGPDSSAMIPHRRHSFLLHPNSPANTLASVAALTNPTSATEPGTGPGAVTGAVTGRGGGDLGGSICPLHPDLSLQSSQCLYNHCNSNGTSTDYFSSRNCQHQHSGQGQGQGQTDLCLVGTTATLASDYAASSVDPCESEHGGTTGHSQQQQQHQDHHHHQLQFNNGHVYGLSSAGSDAPLSMFKNYPYLLRSAPASAVGGIGSKRKQQPQQQQQHCKNCTHHHSRRPSMGGALSPLSAVGSAHTVLGVGGVKMEATGSGTSITGSGRPASPSPGSFRNLSSKLAANTIRKLSVSQRSLFSSSKEDLLAGSNSCQCCQDNNVSREDLNDLVGSDTPSRAGTGCYCCVNRHGAGGFGDESVCSGDGNSSATTPGNSGSSKGLKMPSKLSLRGPSSTCSGGGGGGSRPRKDKSKSRRKSREMEYNLSSQFVREEFAQYNYERQIEDFQRAARVFKEQKALTTAAAAASIAAEARAAIAEAAQTAAAEAAKNKKQQASLGEKSSSSLSASAISPIQETEEDANVWKKAASRHSTHSNDGNLKSRKKLVTSSTRSRGILRSVSRPQRRVGSSIVSISSVKSPHRRSFGSTAGGVAGHGSRGSSIHTGGKSDALYLELGQVGMGMGMDLKTPGLCSEFEFDAKKFEPPLDISSLEGPAATTHGGKDLSAFDVRSAAVSHDRSDATEVFEDIPLRDMTFSLPLSRHRKDSTIKLQEDVHSLKARLSSVSQDTRGGATGAAGDMAKKGDQTRTERSVHSVCSVDTVSQQISARHHQHSRLANLSNVASLHSQYQALHSNCETAIGGVAGGCAAVGGGSSMGAGLGDRSGSSAYQSAASNILENSPIQVVRATVGTVDDTSLPCFTFRMWILSTAFVVMGSAIAEYNFFRSNSAYFSIYFVQLASYFCGKAMARWLPTRVFELSIPGLSWCVERRQRNSNNHNSTSTVKDAGDEGEVGVHSDNSAASSGNGGRRVGSNVTGGPIRSTDRTGFGRSNIANTKTGLGSGPEANNSQQRRRPFSWRFTLNPGKFNMKEHMLIGVAAAAGCTPAYATNVLAIQDLVFTLPLSSLTGIGLVVSSQLIGFSMTWLLFDYVIKPSVMIWPATLVNVSLYNTLHEHKVLTRWFTRMQLFWYAFLAVFLYQWLPRMFMPVLTSMALLCWINPSNNVLRKLGSGYMGLGMGCISLDWSIISGVGPLFTPWWAQCNFFVGLILMLWIITPIIYFSDYWSAMSYPIVSSNLFDNTSQLYDVSKIVNEDLSFNITMYESYSPIIMTPYFAITYGTSFMAVIATFVHVALYYGSDIWLIARTRFSRRATRIQESPFVQSFMILFGKGSQYESGQGTSQSRTTGNASVIDPGHAYIGLEGSSTSESRNSESVSFRNEMADGGAGLGGLTGLGSADDRRSLSQCSHYRQLSQQQQHQQYQDTLFSSGLGQSTSGCLSSLHQGSKHYVDDRDQIPTEMFGTEDIHTALMRAYPEIPGWWFGILFVICFTMAVFVCITTDIRLPVYSLILALVLAAVFAIPMAIIQALSSSQVGLNVLSEVVCGYLLPGNQLGNSVFKCYSYMALYQCLNLTQGFKLGHYMKVPPRKIFITVIYGTLVGAFVNLQVLGWVLQNNRDALFDSDPMSGWSFRNLDLFFSASLLWGAISPKLLFENGSIYHFLPYCFLIGIFLPIPFYIMYRHYPPFGTLCKGDSWFFFLPNCACPSAAAAAAAAAATVATEDGEEVVVVGLGELPELHKVDLTPGGAGPESAESRMAKNLEAGHAGCLPFVKRVGKRHRKAGPSGDKALTDKSANPNSAKSQQPSTPTSVPPHTYYGHPDSVWDNRLRRIPWHLINTPLICVGASFVPQAPASFVTSAGIVAFCFAFLVLRFRHEWWRRYTFVLAAALDAGTQICNMAIFVVFSLILKGAVEFPGWIGNDAVNPEKCGVGDGYN
ncbi:hypothetical protein BGW39_010844 [Mortierella sp. 14UC]|nr:hypothetical protein BGW39_010844 [Mortierella sp. 14UC]